MAAKHTIGKRGLIVGLGIFIFFFVLLGRLYWVQAIEASELRERAKSTWEQSKVLKPTRGYIYDRNGKVLAQDTLAYTVAVNPSLINQEQNAQEVIDILAPALGMDTVEGRKKLENIVTWKNEDGQYVYHREVRSEGWKIDAKVAELIDEQIQEKKINGVYLLEETKRYYPANELASHILGYQNKDGESFMGLEMVYNDLLDGEPGMISYESDLFGYETPTSQVHFEPPVDGKSIKLTIDENIQMYMESAMKEVLERFNPKSMTAIAADPKTMEILGLVSLPGYNPNEYWNIENYTNHAIGSQYEPGSTFKIVTLAAAVEEGLFDPDEKFQSGSIMVSGTRMHDHNYVGWGEITYLEGLLRSSNVSFIKMGLEMLGKEKLEEYIRQFGFGELTGIDLPGEVKGRINFYYPTEIAAATFGQGITVTAIQQLAAISAIANDGKLLKPYIVDEIIDTNTGETVHKNEPEVVRQVISPEAARQTGYYLEKVISEAGATGHSAYLEDYRMAGKTGTAQKVVDGKYSDEEYVVSFIGYAPVEDPQVALFISVDAPDIKGDYRLAGEVTSPLFKEIMSKTLRYLGVSASKVDPDEQAPEIVEVPDVVNNSLAAASNKLTFLNLEAVPLGSGNNVIRQYPEPGEKMTGQGRVYLLTHAGEQVDLPDLTGLSVRDALQICALLEISCEIQGSGYVADQIEIDPENRKWKLIFARPNEEYTADMENESDALTGEEDEADREENSEQDEHDQQDEPLSE